MRLYKFVPKSDVRRISTKTHPLSIYFYTQKRCPVKFDIVVLDCVFKSGDFSRYGMVVNKIYIKKDQIVLHEKYIFSQSTDMINRENFNKNIK